MREKFSVIALTETESALLIGFIAIVSFPLLYLSRQLDNNTLSSWRWVFKGQSISTIILYFLLAVILSYLFSRTSIFERQPVKWLFSLSFLSCASLWSEPELLLDSGRYFLQAKQLSEHGIPYFISHWGEGIQAWTDMPLGSFIYGLIFTFFGENRLLIQLFNSLIFSLSTVLTFLTAQITIGKENSFYAGILLLGMPYLLTQVPLFLVDIHALFFFSLALYTFLVALQDGGPYKIVWAAITIVLAMLSKYSTWPMLLILPLLSLGFLVRGSMRCRNVVLIFLIAALLGSIFFIPKYHVVREQISILRYYQKPALLEWQESLFSSFLFQIHPFISFFAFASLFRAIQNGRWRLLIIGIFTLYFCYQVPRIRYIIPLLPLLAIMAANGLDTLQFIETRRFVCWIAVSFTVILLQCAYLPFFQETGMANIQNAGSYLDTLPGEMVEVYTLPQPQSQAATFISVPQLDLLTQKKIISSQSWLPSSKRPQGYHPLLFTWGIVKPFYYRDSRQGHGLTTVPMVVISGAPIEDSAITTLRGDASLTNIKRFSANSHIFRYKTFVAVIH